MPSALILATDWEKWTAIGTLCAAGATLALAGVTVWLVASTRLLASETAEQLEIERHRLDAAQRPHVFPSPTHRRQDPQRLPLTNAGAGPALNIQGQLAAGPPSGTTVGLVPTSLTPGESRDVVVDWLGASPFHFASVAGTLDYEDIAGGRWRTEFVFDEFGYVRIQRTRLMLRPDGALPGDDEAQPWRRDV